MVLYLYCFFSVSFSDAVKRFLRFTKISPVWLKTDLMSGNIFSTEKNQVNIFFKYRKKVISYYEDLSLSLATMIFFMAVSLLIRKILKYTFDK